jgi:hypothetical protein
MSQFYLNSGGGGGGGITSIATQNATPQFVVSGSSATINFGITNLFLGSSGSSITSGTLNVGYGYQALNAATSLSASVAIGYQALSTGTTGASYSVAVGHRALQNSNASQNVAIGYFAGETLTTGTSCTYVGFESGYGGVSGNNNTFLGALTGTAYTGSESTNILIGENQTGVIGDSHVIRIGTNQTTCFIQGIQAVSVSSPVGFVNINANGQLGSVSSSGTGFIMTITGNSGGAEIPDSSGNFNVEGTGSITVAGTTNTETVQLTGLTNHAVLVGAGTATITKITATANTGAVLQNNAGNDPSYSTSTYPSTNSTGDLIYGSGSNALSTLTLGSFYGSPLITNGTNVKWGSQLQYFIWSEDFMFTGASTYWVQTDLFGGGGSEYQLSIQAAGHPGVQRLYLTSNTSGANYYFCGRHDTPTYLVLGNGLIQLSYIIKLESLSNGTNTYSVRMGVGDTYNGDFVNGVYFQYTDTGSSPAWLIKTSSSSTQTSTITSVNADTNFHTFTIIINAAGSSVSYYIDEVSVGTITTNIPTSIYTCSMIQTLKSAGAGQNNIDVDFASIYWELTSSR